LDALAGKGWMFDHLYATGTRSVRGIEAVVSSFTPTPARSVVKLGKSQHDFFTIADLLHRRGYHNQFIYGGESHFDNMKSFFLGNGFNEIIDQNDYENPNFEGSWGVSDEDLLDRAHEEFIRLHDAGQPFFSLVFSSSNHDPFEFPDGRIALYEQPKQIMPSAVFLTKLKNQLTGKIRFFWWWQTMIPVWTAPAWCPSLIFASRD
jgi:phosphoglycerol transferase MdoB-like AlkP superfamily enzyme